MPDDTVPQEVTAPDEAPAPAAAAAPAEAPAPAPAPARSKSGPRWGVALVLVLVLGVGGGFLLGRATAPDEGPASLADAVSQTAKGDLPVGELDLQELLRTIGEQRGGVLGQILGGKGSGSDAVGSILGGLLDELGGRSRGDRGTGGSASSGAVLGVAAQAAPAGQSGVLVQSVGAGSAAADAGLQANDVITAIDDTAVNSPADLADEVQSHDPGDLVTVTYTRGGTSTTVKVRLGNASTATATPATPATTQAPTSA